MVRVIFLMNTGLPVSGGSVRVTNRNCRVIGLPNSNSTEKLTKAVYLLSPDSRSDKAAGVYSQPVDRGSLDSLSQGFGSLGLENRSIYAGVAKLVDAVERLFVHTREAFRLNVARGYLAHRLRVRLPSPAPFSLSGSSEGYGPLPLTTTPSGLRGFLFTNIKRLLVGGYCRGWLSQNFVDWHFKWIPALKSA